MVGDPEIPDVFAGAVPPDDEPPHDGPPDDGPNGSTGPGGFSIEGDVPPPDAPPDEPHGHMTHGDTVEDEREYTDETLWTKFNKSDSVGRRCRVSRWLEAGRVIVDLSEVDNATNKLKGSTQAFVKVTVLGTWLRAVTNGSAAVLYPPLRGGAIATPENIMVYGGGIVDGQPVSRVFKAHHWPAARDDKGKPTRFDESAFMWRTVLYKAKRSDTGAFIPMEQDAPLSTHSIKMTRGEMAEISYALDMALVNQAAHLPPAVWLGAFTGRRD